MRMVVTSSNNFFNMNQFEETIKAYLDERAKSDPQFAERYANPKKSIEDCSKYIIGWVKAQKREGYADAEILAAISALMPEIMRCNQSVNKPIHKAI